MQESSQVFRKEDIRHILQSIVHTNESVARHVPTDDVYVYRAGFNAAILAVAKAFGIDDDSLSPLRQWVEHHQ